MKTVSTRSEFNELIGEDGRLVEPFELMEGCKLWGLKSVTSLEGLTMAEGCELWGLNSDAILHANPSPQEIEIIKKIPVDKIKMSSWHCGTSHCLAGWAQVLSGREINDSAAAMDGMEVLPSLSPFFYAPNEPVKRLILDLQQMDAGK